ncbi:MAG: cupin domain-containing protein [Pseudomonadota bacterium]
MNTVKVAAAGIALGLGSLIALPAWSVEYTAVIPSDIQWKDAPSIGPGAKIAVIHGDPKSAGPFVMRLKVPPKTKLGVHTHPANENVTILSGTLYFAGGDKFEAEKAKAFGPGGYFSIEQGKPMFAYTKNQEAVLQLHGIGPWGITYLNPEDDPTAKK